jgi:2-polyprenyl-6-methoxyphenol hydroxylase-like FAD-dependent oxidoreductase
MSYNRFAEKFTEYRPAMRTCDVAIVGAGIGGASLAAALARDGFDVVVAEATTEYEDRVRGESMQPWGVAEARALGVEQVLLDAGAHTASMWNQYDELRPPEEAEENPIPIGFVLQGVEYSLNLRHPVACETLADEAVAAGAELHRGVTDVVVEAGQPPSLAFTDARGERVELQPRLVVGADGRNSTIRRQLGIELERQDEIHMVSGLLLEGLDIPNERDFLAAEGDLFMASFHQSGGRLRVYLMPGLSQKQRFSGPKGVDAFLGAVGFSCLPFGAELAAARPAGPLATYPGDDSWTAEPFAPGVVLVGDSAGYNNPIIGQGLSIAMRDARTVRDIVQAGALSPAAFAPYGEERAERLRRLWYIATVLAVAMAEDCDDRLARRQRYMQLMQEDPNALMLMIGAFAGPENSPADAFDGRIIDDLRAAG